MDANGSKRSATTPSELAAWVMYGYTRLNRGASQPTLKNGSMARRDLTMSKPAGFVHHGAVRAIRPAFCRRLAWRQRLGHDPYGMAPARLLAPHPMLKPKVKLQVALHGDGPMRSCEQLGYHDYGGLMKDRSAGDCIAVTVPPSTATSG